jgi:integral membrane protein
MTAALKRYRVMAWVVGCWLLLLVLVAMPLKYAADSPGMVAVVGPIHGFLYMVYLLATLDLARRTRWTPVHTVGVMLAGTIPFLSFVVERRTTAGVLARQP